jgi:hypothetical protein
MDLFRSEAPRLMRALVVVLSVAVVLLLGSTLFLAVRLSTIESSLHAVERRRQDLEARVAELERFYGRSADPTHREALEAQARRKAISDGFKDMANARLGGSGAKPLESPALPHAEAP